ncbi:MAG TPA: IPT/TIG domain-containing protein, partial [Thermoanaerobaculia bacterium]|nr:IPT/TIG domain-containing protein [Thermoanaerobaculia bacterium]
AGLYLMSFAQPPVVSSVSPDSGNTGGGASVTITGSAFQTGATVTFGGTAATSVSVVDANTITATTPAHASGAVDVVVANPDFQSGTLANGFTYVNTPNIPENVLATAQTTETSILVTWSESTGATSYQVWRRAPGVVFTQIDTPTTNSYTDTVTSHTSYLYRIRAVNLSGASADSAPDLATAMLFTNDPLTAGTVVRATHVSEGRMAIDHVRALAGLGPGSYTETVSAGVIIKASHVTQMRTALDEALAGLGLSTAAYTDGTLTGVIVKAVHHQEIRNRVK